MNRRLFPVPVPYFSNCAVLFWNSGLVIERAVGCLAIHFFVRLYEEPTLARRHPEDYPRYKRHVPRWLPRLTPWQDAGAGQGQ
jgi:protein-S-isoprenylcysteine O-methyltransferase Ste14